MTAIALRNDDVRLIRRAQTKASQVALATSTMLRIAHVVEQSWERICDPERDLLRELARMMANPPRPSILGRVRFAAWAFRSAGEEEMREFFAAGDRLKEVLLDAIEREHPNYADFVARGLSEALDGRSTAVASDKISEWLSSVRDSAH